MSTKFNNGLQSFSFHESDNPRLVNEINASYKLMSSNLVANTTPKIEDAAKFLLEKALASQKEPLNAFNKPVTENAKLDFKPILVEEIPFTHNKHVKFRPFINDISIYGSVVNVEMDQDLKLVSVNSSLLPEVKVNTLAGISAGDALKAGSEYIQNQIPSSATPLLYIYFFEEEWRLVYLVRDVISKRPEEVPEEKNALHQHKGAFPNYVDVIVDAQNGRVLKLSPRAMNLTTKAKGDDGNEYEISFRENGSGVELVDEFYNVHTYDVNFQVYSADGTLPGSIVTRQSENWLPSGVSAHYNACKVSAFLKDVLKRNGIDNKGIKLISTVRCIEEDGKHDWLNAAWLPGLKQMVYGQTNSGGVLRSVAVSLDVVAHEIVHGLTDFTSDLEYSYQPGALNESYSDIFGIIISNFHKDRSQWNWELGEDISGIPLRDLSNPGKSGQPAHMDNYWNVRTDHGSVHSNSGIHNKAAYNLITTKGPAGTWLFTVNEIAVLFYLALGQLSSTSGFSDSYRGMMTQAKSLYVNDPSKTYKLDAIQQAFDKVGIK